MTQTIEIDDEVRVEIAKEHADEQVRMRPLKRRLRRPLKRRLRRPTTKPTKKPTTRLTGKHTPRLTRKHTPRLSLRPWQTKRLRDAKRSTLGRAVVR